MRFMSAIQLKWAMNGELSVDKSEKTEDFRSVFYVGLFKRSRARVLPLPIIRHAPLITKWQIQTFRNCPSPM